MILKEVRYADQNVKKEFGIVRNSKRKLRSEILPSVFLLQIIVHVAFVDATIFADSYAGPAHGFPVLRQHADAHITGFARVFFLYPD